MAQVIIEKITETEVVEVDDLNETQRGSGGFGSTGVREGENKSPINISNIYIFLYIFIVFYQKKEKWRM